MRRSTDWRLRLFNLLLVLAFVLGAAATLVPQRRTVTPTPAPTLTPFPTRTPTPTP